MRIQQKIIFIIIIFFVHYCATYKPQYKDENYTKTFPKEKQIEHSFYLIGDGGGLLYEYLNGFNSMYCNDYKTLWAA